MTAIAAELPAVATRDEWLVARLALLEKEKEYTRMRDTLNAQRRHLPMVKVAKDYRFRSPSGEKRLVDLFEARRQLIIHHFMWIDAASEGCPGCSMLVDTVGNLVHLNAANTTLAFVSRAPLAQLEAFRARMGWEIPIVSSAGTDFNYDFQVTLDASRDATTYNFRDVREQGGMIASYTGDLPGVSVFLRDGDDVYHTYSAYARGTEHESNVFGFLDFTPLGRQDGRDAEPWARLHDRYGA
jgi:predicted dithiol-disulfide oxidoreductase (DUF899 family)